MEFVGTSTPGAREIAVTSNVGSSGNRGSLTMSGTEDNVGEALIITYVGMGVRKIGRTTGTTAGEIIATCELNIIGGAPRNDTIVTCGDRVAASSGPGDSGGPVYRRVSVVISEPHESPKRYAIINYPVGILVAGSNANYEDGFESSVYCLGTQCQYIFSPWQNIENRLARVFHVSNPSPED